MRSLLTRIAAAMSPAAKMDGRHLRRSEGLTALADVPELHVQPAQVRRALDAWHDGILEPGQPAIGGATPRPDIISEFIRGPLGIGWGWEKPYQKNGDFEWCGAFAAWCLGDAIKSDDRLRIMPSAYRLHRAAAAGHTGLRRLAPGDAMPGDVLVVRYARGGEPWGDHICMVERVDRSAGLIHTVEGNARGWVTGAAKGDPDACREGVIRRTRPLRPGRHAPCPVSGLKQGAHAFAVYRWELRA